MRFGTKKLLFLVCVLLSGCGVDSSPARFIVNGDSTVSDTVRELVWQRMDGAVERTWDEATTYCSGLQTGGLSGWRLPEKKEALTLVDFSIPAPGPVIASNLFSSTKPSPYWTATPSIDVPSQHWFVGFDNGYAYYADSSNRFRVRCVLGRSMPQPDFVDNGNETVTDRTTGLIWQQSEFGAMTWQDALTFCSTLSLAGYRNWRLPDIISLQSLTDPKRLKPALDPAYFPRVQSTHYWTSSEYMADKSKAWEVGFGNGDLYFHTKTDLPTYVRCVRGS